MTILDTRHSAGHMSVTMCHMWLSFLRPTLMVAESAWQMPSVAATTFDSPFSPSIPPMAFAYDETTGPPPGSPPTRPSFWSIYLCHFDSFLFSLVKYEGPWLSTQIMISSFIGLVSFLVFSYSRTRWPLLFAPRTKLKGTCPRIIMQMILP